MKRAWEWVKAKWGYFALAVVLLFGVIFGVKSIRERNEAKLSAQARRDVAKARAKLIALRESRAEIAGRIDARQEEIELVNAHVATTQRVIVQAYEETQGMNDDEVLARFKSLGYE